MNQASLFFLVASMILIGLMANTLMAVNAGFAIVLALIDLGLAFVIVLEHM